MEPLDLEKQGPKSTRLAASHSSLEVRFIRDI